MFFTLFHFKKQVGGGTADVSYDYAAVYFIKLSKQIIFGVVNKMEAKREDSQNQNSRVG